MLLALSLLNFVFRTLPSSALCNVISRGMTLRSFYPGFIYKVFRILGCNIYSGTSIQRRAKGLAKCALYRELLYIKVLSCIFYY